MALFPTPGNGAPNDPLQVARFYITLAIQIGAPAYNRGDRRGCYDVYACTARLILGAVKGEEKVHETLRKALEKCSKLLDVDEQAWTMRRAFDYLLGESEDPGLD